jgi:cysteine-rich repeat protein
MFWAPSDTRDVSVDMSQRPQSSAPQTAQRLLWCGLMYRTSSLMSLCLLVACGPAEDFADDLEYVELETATEVSGLEYCSSSCNMGSTDAPNGRLANGTECAFGVPLSSALNQTFGTTTDVDWFKFTTLDDGARHVYTFFTSSSIDTTCELFDSPVCGSARIAISYSSNSGTDADCGISLTSTWPSKTYYVRVTSNGTYTATDYKAYAARVGKGPEDNPPVPDVHPVDTRCGDGYLDYEQCDDGNTWDGDGCSSSCEVESFEIDPPPCHFHCDWESYPG